MTTLAESGRIRKRARQLIAGVALGTCAFTLQAGPVSGQGSWESTLLGRDLDGDSVNDAWYDTDLKITWLELDKGPWDYYGAKATVTSLIVGGFTDWRLPSVNDMGTAGCPAAISYSGPDCGVNLDPSSSEFAHLWYVTLGNLGAWDTAGNNRAGGGLTNTGPFQNLHNDIYWTGTIYPADARAWYFNMATGLQWHATTLTSMYYIAVRDGDVASVEPPAPMPVPSPFVLGLAGLLALGVTRHRKTH